MAKATRTIKQEVTITTKSVKGVRLELTQEEAQAVYHLVNGSRGGPNQGAREWDVYEALKQLGFKQINP